MNSQTTNQAGTMLQWSRFFDLEEGPKSPPAVQNSSSRP